MNEEQAEAYLKAMAALLALPIDPAHRPGIIANLRLAARMAAMVEGRALAIHDEPAPVFRP